MLLYEREIKLPPEPDSGKSDLIGYFHRSVESKLEANEIPIRFAVTQSDKSGYHCELGVMSDAGDRAGNVSHSIFDISPRKYQNSDKFNVVMLVPTGIGSEVGGHAGDAGPAARLLASVADTLITHPNVVNASDINELPDNALYAEGSVICRMLMGTAALQIVRSNRVMLLIDEHEEEQITELVINSASAARSTLGMACPRVVRMDPPIKMRAELSSSGSAVGRIENLTRLCDVLERYKGDYDAIALATLIEVPHGIHEEYFSSDGSMVNPWGGVEAMLTHAVSSLFNVPSAHAPMMESLDLLGATFGVVDPRMSAEAVSRCFLHCVLKGLHRSPRIVTDPSIFTAPGVISANDISCMVIPDRCLGLPTLAAMAQGIPVITVRENENCMKNSLEELPFADGMLISVDNYLEAAGVLAAMKGGVAIDTVRRPMAPTAVVSNIVPQDATVDETTE